MLNFCIFIHNSIADVNVNLLKNNKNIANLQEYF